jgi:hypothetical protein
MLAAAATAQTIIVDNSDPGFSVLSQTWSTGTSAPGHWGPDYRYRQTTASGAAFGEVEWRPNLPAAGAYQVAIYYPQGGNRANDAPFTVYHADGADVFPVDQQQNGGQWNVLGTFEFNAGNDGCVRLSNDANPTVVIADAVSFTSVGPEFRGFWADAFHSGFKSTGEIDTMIGWALAGNYNAIIPEVLAFHDTGGGGHGAYWNSGIVPKASDIAGGIDPLAYLVQQAHASGLEVHAWLVAFRVSATWPPAGNPLVAAHPEWLMVRQADMNQGPLPVVDGDPNTTDYYTLDPGAPDAQEYLMSIVRELCADYEIDGVHWDYIRYTQTDAGYPTNLNYPRSTLRRFQNITGYVGVPPPTGVASATWCAGRCSRFQPRRTRVSRCATRRRW